MISVPEGGSPSADDMMILDMVLDSIKDALKYSAEATMKIRQDFKIINKDLNGFGDHMTKMLGIVAKNIQAPIDSM